MLARYTHALKRAKKKKAVPQWADRRKIFEIYQKCPRKMRVDHIIPLNNPLVSGLHVPENLQYISEKDNQDKANKFEPLIIVKHVS